jgi:solute carrier family 20 (sodium-dependent phosphate transporter)
MSELDLSTDIEQSYLWIVIVGGIFGFFAAMGIGANDVANAFATSVGSKALRIKDAIIIALFCEAGGAILLGSHVVDTIRKGIADYECFTDNPPVLMFGAMSVLLSVGIWLFVASYFEMPVSTTHSTVAGMIAMTWVTGGTECVNWYEPSDNFPYVGGVAGIFLSWVISPVFSGLLAMMFFAIIRAAVLRRPDSFNKAFWSFPIFVGITIVLNIFLLIYKGAKGVGLDDIELWVALVSAFGCGLAVGLIMIPFLPMIKKGILKRIEKQKAKKISMIEMGNIKGYEGKTIDSLDSSTPATVGMSETNGSNNSLASMNTEDSNDIHSLNSNEVKNTSCYDDKNMLDCSKDKCMKNKYCKALTKSLNYDVEKDIIKHKRVGKIHDNSEKFDENTEESFKFLQIFTAIFDSFSHGANDVANAIGPFAAIYVIYKNKGKITEDLDLGTNSYWILALGGFGIIIGLALYGYKIIRAIGVKMCTITPSRGVAIELSSAMVIIIGSRLGIPLSTTHCQIGATMGVASLEDLKKCSGLNCVVVGKTFLGWILTMVVVGLTTALLVAYSVYAPWIGTEYTFNTTNYTNLTTMLP